MSPEEVKMGIRKLNNAPDYDLITAEVLKKMPRKGIVFLTTIFNRLLSLCYFPVIWKYPYIIMIHENGKPLQETLSYRPISLLRIPSKYSKDFSKIQDEYDPANTLPNYQFGF
ncbi:hypothetical protein JTB14_034250 [Gonioctena quinquepunctata]|nr:hypothetical protein JTB14_034250 [Gonioctena quinquepunctata]